MKSQTRYLSAAFALALLVSAACNKNEAGGDSKSVASDESSPAKTQEAVKGAVPEFKGAPDKNDYQAIAAKHGLKLVLGLPLVQAVGFMPADSLSLTREQSSAASRFFDFAALGADPSLIDKAPECWAENYLAEPDRQTYLATDSYYSSWKGANEFEQQRSREAFLAERAGAFRADALSLPIQALEVHAVTLDAYDTAQGGFPLRWSGNYGVGGKCATLQYHVTFPRPAAFWPQIWRLDPGKAEGVLGELGPDRKIYVALKLKYHALPVTALPAASSVSPEPMAGAQRYWAELMSMDIYGDVALTRQVGALDVRAARPPALMTGTAGLGRPDEISAEKIGLLVLKYKPDFVSDEQLRQLMVDQHRHDITYYQSVQSGPGYKADRDNWYDASYVPFFTPEFNSNNYTQAQFALFKEWVLARAKALPERLSLPVDLTRIDNKVTLALDTAETAMPGMIDPLKSKDIALDRTFVPRQLGNAYVLAFPKETAKYVPQFSAADAERIFGASATSYDTPRANLIVNVRGLNVLNNGSSEVALVDARPVEIVVKGPAGGETLFKKRY